MSYSKSVLIREQYISKASDRFTLTRSLKHAKSLIRLPLKHHQSSLTEALIDKLVIFARAFYRIVLVLRTRDKREPI